MGGSWREVEGVVAIVCVGLEHIRTDGRLLFLFSEGKDDDDGGLVGW